MRSWRAWWSWAAGAAMGGLACGCAASPARVAGPPVHIDLPPSIVTADEVTTEAELEARGERALLEQRWKEAGAADRRLLAADPVGPRASEHMFDLGLSLEGLEARADARDTFLGLAR